MTDAWTELDSIVKDAMLTNVGLLDALLDACMAAQPGHDAARYAADLFRLGRGAAQAAADLTALAEIPADARAAAAAA